MFVFGVLNNRFMDFKHNIQSKSYISYFIYVINTIYTIYTLLACVETGTSGFWIWISTCRVTTSLRCRSIYRYHLLILAGSDWFMPWRVMSAWKKGEHGKWPVRMFDVLMTRDAYGDSDRLALKWYCVSQERWRLVMSITGTKRERISVTSNVLWLFKQQLSTLTFLHHCNQFLFSLSLVHINFHH